MPDVLIRDIPDDVLAALDARAARLGLSCVEYIRRRLAQDATAAVLVSAADLLIDKSGLVRLPDSPDADEWANRIQRGRVRITTLTRLEVGCSARSGGQARAAMRAAPLAAVPVEYLTPAIEDRAVDAQVLLADLGRHRAPSIPDLLIAATAELAGVTMLQVDKDFELIASITGQPIERLAT